MYNLRVDKWQQLAEQLPGKVSQHQPLAELTTLQIGGAVRLVCAVNNTDDLIQAVKLAHQFELPFLVIGSGSNLLVTDQPQDLLVIHNQISGISQEQGVLTVQAGTLLQQLVDYTIEHGLDGMSTMTGVPGTVGGAIYGSAGAYGDNIRDHLIDVTYFDGQQTQTIDRQQYQTGYRDSFFKQHKNYVILSARFGNFDSADPAQLKQEAEQILVRRQEKYPPNTKCPGSFFKNVPVEQLSTQQLDKIRQELKAAGKDPDYILRFAKVPAGPLLELVGANGQQLGQIKVTNHHGNTIVNLGGGSADDFWQLAKTYADKVEQKFGVRLEPEVQLIGLPPLTAAD